MMPMTWRRMVRIALLTAGLFVLLNGLFAAIPRDALGRFSLYGSVFPYRERLPYGAENAPYALTITHLPALLHSHVIQRPRAADEYRVVLLGDSGTWGWWLPVDETLSAAITAQHVRRDGRRVVAYNLAYPNMTLSKDVLLLEAALAHQPDLIIWLVTLNAFQPGEQLDSGLLFDNPAATRRLIACCGLPIDPADPAFREPSVMDRTLIGARRELSALLRLQLSGAAWAATGRDAIIPDPVPRLTNDFAADDSWGDYPAPVTLTRDDLAFAALDAGRQLAASAGVPLWIVNAPTFRADGANSDRRYSLWYPRWAYDQYRDLLAADAAAHPGVPYADHWDAIDPRHFTDSPAHMDAIGTRALAALLFPP